MFCKICERDHPVDDFNDGRKMHICDNCLSNMGYDHKRMGEMIVHHYQKTLDKILTKKVQQALPAVVEKLMVENDLTFELKVI